MGPKKRCAATPRGAGRPLGHVDRWTQRTDRSAQGELTPRLECCAARRLMGAIPTPHGLVVPHPRAKATTQEAATLAAVSKRAGLACSRAERTAAAGATRPPRCPPRQAPSAALRELLPGLLQPHLQRTRAQRAASMPRAGQRASATAPRRAGSRGRPPSRCRCRQRTRAGCCRCRRRRGLEPALPPPSLFSRAPPWRRGTPCCTSGRFPHCKAALRPAGSHM
mmetsp:Transcript_73326/g.218872  ORF Transcript_73326/g.218872 Transcript_73326/m.218872 type:complete len:223 (-) Transcript_73326:1844-2512(-)